VGDQWLFGAKIGTFTGILSGVVRKLPGKLISGL